MSWWRWPSTENGDGRIRHYGDILSSFDSVSEKRLSAAESNDVLVGREDVSRSGDCGAIS